MDADSEKKHVESNFDFLQIFYDCIVIATKIAMYNKIRRSESTSKGVWICLPCKLDLERREIRCDVFDVKQWSCKLDVSFDEYRYFIIICQAISQRIEYVIAGIIRRE